MQSLWKFVQISLGPTLAFFAAFLFAPPEKKVPIRVTIIFPVVTVVERAMAPRNIIIQPDLLYLGRKVAKVFF